VSDFTYDPASDIGYVRSQLGDTKAQFAFFTDPEIEAAISRQGSPEGAIAQLAGHRMAEAANRAASRTEGNARSSVSIDDTRQPEYWAAILKRFEKFLRASVPYAETMVSPLASDGLTERGLPYGRGDRVYRGI
jgi:hypothetical protein